MKIDLQVRRQELLRDLERIKRQIAWTQKSMAHLESRIAAAQQRQSKAA